MINKQNHTVTMYHVHAHNYTCMCVHVVNLMATASPVVTLSVADRELLSERNEFEGDGLTVAEQV